MKHYLLFLIAGILLVGTLSSTQAQIGFNSPTSVKPTQDFEVYTRNGFLVQQKYTLNSTDPSANINNLSCANYTPWISAQAGIMKDPGGDSNYEPNLSCSQQIIRSSISAYGKVIGYEIVFEDLDTEAGNDRVIITDFNSNTLIFSGNSLPAPFITVGILVTIRFESNSNNTVGRGFRLRWREINVDESSPVTIPTAFGNALQFDAKKGALLSGLLTPSAIQQVGSHSIALGRNNKANGITSTAIGSNNAAIGDLSIAFGVNNKANGYSSSALGNNNTVSSDNSTAVGTNNVINGTIAMALGFQNIASGSISTALGFNNIASGDRSTAIGAGATTGGFSGAMILGDHPLNSSQLITATASTTENQLTARFRGGFRFISDYNTTTGAINSGAILAPGSNSWATISDSTKKERFLPLNSADILHKISTLKLGTWNYKNQPDQRHYGPMAQDFFVRFGHDSIGTIGCDTLLASHDFTAVTLAGVQALIHENKQLQEKLAQTEARLNATIEQNNARLKNLETLLIPRRRGRIVAQK